jgi:hypothetical protein
MFHVVENPERALRLPTSDLKAQVQLLTTKMDAMLEEEAKTRALLVEQKEVGCRFAVGPLPAQLKANVAAEQTAQRANLVCAGQGQALRLTLLSVSGKPTRVQRSSLRTTGGWRGVGGGSNMTRWYKARLG